MEYANLDVMMDNIIIAEHVNFAILVVKFVMEEIINHVRNVQADII